MLVNIQKQSEHFTPTVLSFIPLLLGVILISSAAIFIRLSEQEIGANATIFNRLWIATVFFGSWNAIASTLQTSPSYFSLDNKSKLSESLGLFIFSAITDLSCLLLWAWSLNQTSITNSTVLHNLTPIFAILGGWIWLNQSFNVRFITGGILASLGASAIALSDLQFANLHLIGDGLALLSAVFSGISYLLYERLRVNFSARTLLSISCFLRSILLLPIVLITEPQVFPSSGLGWCWVIGLGLLCQVLGNLIIIHHLKQFSASFISLFLLLDPIFTATLAWLVFAEQISIYNWIACGIILIGIYFAKSGQGSEKEPNNNKENIKVDLS